MSNKSAQAFKRVRDERDNLREWLGNIRDVCVDYDGYTTVEGLKSLVDDLRGMSKDALNGRNPRIKQDPPAGDRKEDEKV